MNVDSAVMMVRVQCNVVAGWLRDQRFCGEEPSVPVESGHTVVLIGSLKYFNGM